MPMAGTEFPAPSSELPTRSSVPGVLLVSVSRPPPTEALTGDPESELKALTRAFSTVPPSATSVPSGSLQAGKMVPGAQYVTDFVKPLTLTVKVELLPEGTFGPADPVIESTDVFKVDTVGIPRKPKLLKLGPAPLSELVTVSTTPGFFPVSVNPALVSDAWTGDPESVLKALTKACMTVPASMMSVPFGNLHAGMPELAGSQ